MRPSKPQGVRPRRLIWLLVAAITLVSILAAVLARVLAGDDFPTFGIAIWWSLQTVTTVGYGDVIPQSTSGKVVAGCLMVAGYAFVAVITAAVATAFMRGYQSRHARVDTGDPVLDSLARIEERLDAVERHL